MASDLPSDLIAEIGHVLFVDIVGYHSGPINEVTDVIDRANVTGAGSTSRNG